MNDVTSQAPQAASDHSLVTTPISAETPRWTHRLRDGTGVLIRALRKEDAALERTFIERLSPASRRFRFLGQIASPSDELIRSLTDIDYVHDVAFVALLHADNEKKEIGVARYGTSADGTRCECAVTVADEWQGRGLGTVLLEHLIDVARERGIREMYSIDAADNHAMRDLADAFGFTRTTDPDDPTLVTHRLRL